MTMIVQYSRRHARQIRAERTRVWQELGYMLAIALVCTVAAAVGAGVALLSGGTLP
jgi:hypothetical protein